MSILFEAFTVAKLDFQLQAKDMKLRKLRDGGFAVTCPACGCSNKFYEGYMTSAVPKARDVAKTAELLEEVEKARKQDFVEWLVQHSRIKRKFQNETFTAMKSTSGTIKGKCSRCLKEVKVSVSASVPKKLMNVPIPFWKATTTISGSYASASEESFFEVRDEDSPLHIRELQTIGRTLYEKFMKNKSSLKFDDALAYRIKWPGIHDRSGPEAAKAFSQTLQRYLKQLEFLPRLGKKLKSFWERLEAEAEAEDLTLPYELSKLATQYKDGSFVKKELKRVRRRILENLLWLWEEISRHAVSSEVE